MNAYSPPFLAPTVVSLARRRNLVAATETVPEGFDRVARELARIDTGFSGASAFGDQLLDAFRAGRLAPSSQLMSGLGRDSCVAACTVLSATGTNDASRLRRVLQELDASSRHGMGCGIDLSHFTDPVAALMAVNDAALQLNRQLVACNQRPPALMVTCAAEHPRAAAFANAKRGANLAEWVANISLRVSRDEKTWQALLPLIAESAHGNGEPGVLFQAVADEDNPTPGFELSSTAPCAEVFLAVGERCVFLTINLAAHVRDNGFDWPLFRESVRLAVRAGDAAVEVAGIDAAAVVHQRRRIGIGVCGYHSALIALGVPYADSTSFAQEVAENLVFGAHLESALLAEARGPFPAWAGSRWRDPAWVRRKAARRAGHVDPKSWQHLERAVARHGIRHAAVVAFPPTGVIAEVLGVSRSYEPHFSLAGQTGLASRREVKVVPEAAAFLSGRVREPELLAEITDPATGYQLRQAPADHVLACARQIPVAAHVGVHAAFTLLADEAGSKTVNLPAHTTVTEVAEVFSHARKLGLKGIAVFRDGCLN